MTDALARRFATLLFGLALATAGSGAAQQIDLVQPAQSCPFGVGVPTSVEVTDAPAGAEIDWGDGTVVSIDAGTGTYDHVYVAPGDYLDAVLLLDEQGATLDATGATIYEHLLTPTVSTLLLGEELELVLAAEPDDSVLSDFADLDWDDGNVDAVNASGTYRHTYALPGSYRIELDAYGCLLGTAEVEVRTPGITVLPSRPTVGQTVTASLDDEPAQGEIAWGDGDVATLNGTGAYDHAYDAPGPYTIELLADGAPVAQTSIEVIDPAIELDASQIVLGELVTATVTDPPQNAEIDWGDGAFESGVGDGDYEHRYASPGGFEVRLIDASRGATVASASLTVTDIDETVTVTDVDYRAADGEIVVTYELDDLAPDLEYDLRAGAFAEYLVGSAGSRTVVATYFEEGTFDAVLVVRSSGEERTRTTVELSWPRAAETLLVTEDEPYLAGDFISFEALGLNPDYRYRLSLDDPNGIEQTVEGASAWTEIGYYPDPGLVRATLEVAYPGFAEQWELRADAVLDVQPRTGTVSLSRMVVPYAQQITVEADDLSPGRRYRIDFGGGDRETFVASGATESWTRAFQRLPTVVLESYARGRDVWEYQDAVTAERVAFTGTIEPEGGGTSAGATQTLVASDLAPDQTYVLALSRAVPNQDGFADLVAIASAQAVADEDGTARVDVVVPEAEREVLWPTELYAELRLVLDEENELQMAAERVALPPLRRVLATFPVEITEMLEPFTLESWYAGSFRAHGVVRDMAIGGRSQGDVGFTFEGRDRATLREPLSWTAPASLRGLELTFSRIELAAPQATEASTFAGTGKLHGASLTFDADGAGAFRQILDQKGEFMVMVEPSDTTTVPIGPAGWVLTMGGALMDLAPNARYNWIDERPGATLEDAYAGWSLAGRTPQADPASDAWTGIFFLPSGQGTAVKRDPAVTPVAESIAFTDAPNHEIAVGWTGEGFSLSYTGRAVSQHDGWDVETIEPYAFTVAGSQLVAETPLRLQLQLPYFGVPYLVEALPTVGPQERGLRIVGNLPVARDFGMSALIADQPRFEVRDDGFADLVFGRAVWALDSDLASDPADLDASTAATVRSAVDPDVVLPPTVQSGLDATLAALATAEDVLALQLPLNGLTLSPQNNAGTQPGISLNGQPWATLAATPEMDVYGFPYMSGASAEIGVRDDGDGDFSIGLRGSLSLGSIVRAEAAPSWYEIENGRERRWVFEGVSAAMSDKRGLVELPATFSLTLGGLVSLEDGDDSLELSGSGSLNVGFGGGGSGGSSEAKQVLDIEVAGVFGINDTTADATPYWFVYAGVDLAAMDMAIPVKVKGVDVFAFYVFRGGIGHNLRLDQRTGNAANDTCAVDDAFVGTADDGRPSVVKNALACFDDDNDLALLAGTIIGSYQKAMPDGFVWHLNANLTVNSAGQVVLGGRGWTMKDLDRGFRLDAAPNLMARISADENAILGSFCLGNVGRPIGELACTGLEPLNLTAGGFKLIEATANAELRASWSSGEYYFALGRQSLPIDLYIFPDFTRGYLVAGHVRTAGLIEAGVPATGVWASMDRGKSFSWSKGFDGGLCTVTASASAYFSFGGAIAMQFEPTPAFDGAIRASAGARAGVSGCTLDTSVSVRMAASGRIVAPSPFRFSGSVRVTADLPIIGDIDVNVSGVTLSL